MVYVARLIFALWVFVCSDSFGSISFGGYQSPAAGNNPSVSFNASDPVTACNLYLGSISSSLVAVTTSNASAATGYCSTSSGAGAGSWSKVTSCPANSTLSGSSCTCNSGYQQVSASCVADLDKCSSKAGLAWTPPASGGAWKTSRSGAFTFCPQTGGTTTCVVTGSSIASDGSGNTYIYGPYAYAGGLCAQVGIGTSETTSPVKCSAGQYPGTVNGQSVCVPGVSTVDKDVKSSVTAASSVASGSTTTTTSSSGTSSTSTTACVNGNCTTTTTTTSTNPDGSTGTSQTSTNQSQADYCAQNPQAASCKAQDQSQWAGACSGGFQCTGDAVQCAQAQAAWQSACALQPDASNQQYQDGQAALTSQHNFVDTGVSNPFAIDGYISQYTGLGPADNCPQDLVIPFPGQNFTIPFSNYCVTLHAVGLAGNGVTMIIAMLIVFGGSGSMKD